MHERKMFILIMNNCIAPQFYRESRSALLRLVAVIDKGMSESTPPALDLPLRGGHFFSPIS